MSASKRFSAKVSGTARFVSGTVPKCRIVSDSAGYQCRINGRVFAVHAPFSAG